MSAAQASKTERVAHLVECLRELIEDLSGIPRGLRRAQAQEIMRAVVQNSRLYLEAGPRWGNENREVLIAVPNLDNLYLAMVDDVIESSYEKIDYFLSN